jgi:hypothetical protein
MRRAACFVSFCLLPLFVYSIDRVNCSLQAVWRWRFWSLFMINIFTSQLALKNLQLSLLLKFDGSCILFSYIGKSRSFKWNKIRDVSSLIAKSYGKHWWKKGKVPTYSIKSIGIVLKNSWNELFLKNLHILVPSYSFNASYNTKNMIKNKRKYFSTTWKK